MFMNIRLRYSVYDYASRTILLQVLEFKKTTASNIWRNMDLSSGHVFRVVKDLRKGKILDYEKDGRTVHIWLTKKGRKIAINFRDIERVLKNE